MNPTDDRDLIERRTWLKGLAAGVAGAMAPGEAAAADAPHAHPAAAEQAANAPAPRLLDDHQRNTLASLAEILVPGSVKAGVVDLIDRVASVDGPARQRQLLNAIGKFDRDAQSAHGVRWIDLGAAVQLDWMQRLSDGREKDAAHFSALRLTVMNAYLTTEPGMKEFGWAGRDAWREVPGCPHPQGAHE